MKTTFRATSPKKKPPPEPVRSLELLRGVPPGAPPWRTLAARAARRRCPVCGAGELFADRLTIRERCPECRFRFEREEGYWLGAMTLNYGFVAALVTLGLLLTNALWDPPALLQLGIWSAAATGGIFWFFPYSRLAWIVFDFLFLDPPAESDFPPGPGP